MIRGDELPAAGRAQLCPRSSAPGRGAADIGREVDVPNACIEHIAVHIHLDSKFRVESLEDLFGKSAEEADAEQPEARGKGNYKRADLLFSDLNRLRAIREKAGPFLIVFGGKAHPKDEAGKTIIRKVVEAAAALRDSIPVVYVENYDMRWRRYSRPASICGSIRRTVPLKRPAPAA